MGFNGNSSFGLDKANSFGMDDRAAATMPIWFRWAMPVPVMLVSGL